MSAVLASFVFASAVSAKVLPRNLPLTVSEPFTSFDPILPTTDLPTFPSVVRSSSSSVFPTTTPFNGTLFVPLPTQAYQNTNTTVSACTQADGSFVPSIVVIGTTTGTFTEGAITIPVPPQASPNTFYYYDSNGDGPTRTETIILEPLPGNCEPFTPPAPTSNPTVDIPVDPSATAGTCPTEGCTSSEKLGRAAERIVKAINEVTAISSNLQAAAKRIGEKPSFFPGADEEANVNAALGPIVDIQVGLISIANSVTRNAPYIITLPAFPVGCAANTIVLAWLEFVRVHQALLRILIGRSGLLATGPFKRDDVTIDGDGDGDGDDLEKRGLVGAPIAAALRGVEKVVDTLAVAIVAWVPDDKDCTNPRTAELKKDILEAERSYDS